MLQIKTKIFKSLDGFFNKDISYVKTSEFEKITEKKISILGKGHSISGIPYNEKSILIDPILEEKIIFNKKKEEIEVNGNIEIYKIHNFLTKRKFYFPSFPSYPNVSLGTCVANCVHGNSPKNGIIRDYLNEIEIYNPNFGYKTLTSKKNKKLFDLTVGGMGMTGIITKVKLKVFKLKSSYIKIDKNIKFTNLIDIYEYLCNSKYIYNQNNIFINRNSILARVSSGSFINNRFKTRILKKKKIYPIRLGIFKISIFKIIIEKIILIKELYLGKKFLHINEALYPSNNRILYFNLLGKKFIEHQTIIPHVNTKKFLKEFEKIIKSTSPNITLCHYKIFKGKAKYLQFNGEGLALSLHVSINKNFKKFFKKFLDLNKKYNCIINIYKNSCMDNDKIKDMYGPKYKSFSREIKKINNRYLFVNGIFNKKNFYK